MTRAAEPAPADRPAFRVAAAYTTVAMGLAQIAFAASTAIVAGSTSPQVLGLDLTVISLGLVAAALIDFGQNNFIMREAASLRLSAAESGSRLATKLWASASLALVPGIVAALVGGDLAERIFTGALVCAAAVAFQAVQVPLRVASLNGTIATGLLLDKTTCLCVVLVVKSSAGLSAGALVIAVASGFAVSSAFMLARLFLRPATRVFVSPSRAFAPVAWQSAWKGTRGYGIASVLGQAQVLDVPLLTLAAGAPTAGIYGAVSRWTTPVLLPSSALTQILTPHAARIENRRDGLRVVASGLLFTLPSVIVAIGIVAFAPQLTVLLLGPRFATAAHPLAILALAALPALAAQPLAMLLQAWRLDSIVSSILTVGLAIRLGSCLALPSIAGVTAAAYGVLIQQIVILGWLVILVVRHLDRGTGAREKAE